MNRGILHKYRLLAIALMLVCLSCSKEQLSQDADITIGNAVEMRLKIYAPMASAVSNSETDINRLRVVVFGSTTSPDAGRLIMNKFYATAPAGNIFKEIITLGMRDIFIIVNEPLTGGGVELDSYKKIASVADIRALSLIYGGAGSLAVYTPSEIPMFLSHINKQVLVDNPNEISGAVERVMAKISMKLNVNYSYFSPGKHVVIDNIIVKNLPQSSSWIAKDYVGALVSSEKQSIQAVAPALGYDASSNNTFYVPEYIFSNTDNGAYIEILGHVNGDVSRTCKYIVKLGDAMDDGGAYGDKYHITRNRHYTFTGNVKSYGDLAVKVAVLPWNTVNMDEENGRYVAFSKVADASNVVIAVGSNLDDMGQTIKVSCNTNVGRWYAVVRNAKGGVVHTSAPTAAVTTATEQTVDVVVPRIGELTYLQSYTISLYHPTIANENIGPIKELKFTQHSGFIPNSVLAAAGWPANRLPATGLHLAKRGNNILPGGTPEADDPQKKWKTSETSTIGVEAVVNFVNAKLGMGKASTDAMAALASEHAAAAYCRTIGPEWYLPSIAELKLIYDNKSLLGTSYTFTESITYWSSSENGDHYSWFVFFGDGTTAIYTKVDPDKVRCVREI